MAVHPFSTLARFLLLGLFTLSVTANKPNNPCVNPKVRKEWRELTKPEQEDYIRAVNCLGALPHDPKLQPSVPPEVSLIVPVTANSSYYDDIVYMHMDLNVDIHYTGYFLTWHRYYVQFFEDSLINKCGYKGTQPYWDWTIDAHDIYNAGVWDDSPSGLGSWGDPNNDFQINTGGFKDQIRAYPVPHHIRRNFSLYPFTNAVFSDFVLDLKAWMPNATMTRENVDNMINSYDGDFIGFQAYFESINGSHPGPHLTLSGDMGGLCPFGIGPPVCRVATTHTPNDPMFFFHHAMVDKIWYQWQRRSLMNKYAFAGGSVSAFLNLTTDFITFPTGEPPYLNFSSKVPGDGFWDDVTIWDVMDPQAGPLCYTYTGL